MVYILQFLFLFFPKWFGNVSFFRFSIKFGIILSIFWFSMLLVFHVQVLHFFLFVKFLMYFDAIVNCIFKFSISDCLLLVYRDTVDFFFLSIDVRSLVNSGMSYRSLSVDSIRFPAQKIMPSVNDSFSPSCLIWMPFLSSLP